MENLLVSLMTKEALLQYGKILLIHVIIGIIVCGLYKALVITKKEGLFKWFSKLIVGLVFFICSILYGLIYIGNDIAKNALIPTFIGSIGEYFKNTEVITSEVAVAEDGEIILLDISEFLTDTLASQYIPKWALNADTLKNIANVALLKTAMDSPEARDAMTRETRGFYRIAVNILIDSVNEKGLITVTSLAFSAQKNLTAELERYVLYGRIIVGLILFLTMLLFFVIYKDAGPAKKKRRA
ncbi:MAG: hypothetical protein LBG87_05905 [Spirochaetaceae bacterium]|jgi:hypothetical protein|nr:hypothetical protein [Spirochaetaceae bacterium]